MDNLTEDEYALLVQDSAAALAADIDEQVLQLFVGEVAIYPIATPGVGRENALETI